MRQQTSISHSENIYYFYAWQDGNITCGHNVIVNPNGVLFCYSPSQTLLVDFWKIPIFSNWCDNNGNGRLEEWIYSYKAYGVANTMKFILIKYFS